VLPCSVSLPARSQSEKARETLRKRAKQELSACAFSATHHALLQTIFPSLARPELYVSGFLTAGVAGSSHRGGDPLDAWLMLEDDLHRNLNPSVFVPLECPRPGADAHADMGVTGKRDGN